MSSVNGPRRFACCWLLALAFCSAGAPAHHSQQPFFHMDRDIVLEGRVRAFDFINPHPVIFLDVTDPAGRVVQWQVEGPTAIFLSRTGWSKNSLQPGDVIAVRGAPPKNPASFAMAGREVTKADGTVLRLYADDPRRVLDLTQ